ncbi:MAG: TIM barrel protein, partial [Spirochaeta sp.]|nr:TIM barrel protein [Spirochaeta sp.]
MRHVGIVLSYGIGLPESKDTSSLDETIRLSAVDYMKRMIDAVAEMGGGMIGGTIHSYWPGTMPEGMEDKQPIREQSVKSMKELAPYAHERDVVLNVEVLNRFEQFLVNDSHEAVDYVAEIDHPGCRILLDTFHMNIEEDSIGEAIRRVGPH